MEKHESNIIHPGIILKEDIISPAGLSVTEAAAFLGISRLSLSKVINEKGSITPNIALRLEKVFGGKADFWLRLQRNYDLEKERINFRDNPPLVKTFKYPRIA
ncbi:HigA family addiction module antidote protein [Parapedobacter sp. SGR-10]|uniref:HigA family addiction module antitoxin n=1 Tax=Parapedobacter sp. SGR-10 TaxID=2710879 RepID=UPI0013D374D6|nr:HigA family addiction module antitoxin [Parapedobacter sp. SGR-10]NGF58103.1 HigA family addiction module antidote protein [Parapedobacter sp. SGR-10]